MREDKRSGPISSKLRSLFLEYTSLTFQIYISLCQGTLEDRRAKNKSLIGERRFHLKWHRLKKTPEKQRRKAVLELWKKYRAHVKLYQKIYLSTEST